MDQFFREKRGAKHLTNFLLIKLYKHINININTNINIHINININIHIHINIHTNLNILTQVYQGFA